MKQATITLTDDLEKALDRYLEGFVTPPDLDVIVRRALETYLAARGIESELDDTSIIDGGDIIYPTGPKPEPLEDPPALLSGGCVSDTVIEDRR
jgi:hypothetical protein